MEKQKPCHAARDCAIPPRPEETGFPAQMMTQSLREAITASLKAHGPSATWHLRARGLGASAKLRNELRKMQAEGLVLRHNYSTAHNLVWELASTEQAGETPEQKPGVRASCSVESTQDASIEELEIVTDESLDKAWGYANFGGYTRRQVLRLAVLKCASGYCQGHTSRQIAYDCGLIDEHYQLTAKGRAYLWHAFRDGESF